MFTVNQDIDVDFEPLPGYRLVERLGAGGYGEVWRAEAPGGLTKAIKFVFGKQHEKRAANELRALDHVRSVRHPFLLSLERIEIVEGRLLVVTELADKSVKDRFDACRREGLRGISREELLGYLRDTADALDFMSETHALQHLDIKPENLLLLAGHVKVADFGLVKDVRQSQASLVGGMTPLYAAPEVFRGTPSRYSDQYSLAIVYQEMLTGTLPFAGGNVAELTLQHLNDEPDLSPLAGADHYVVARALSKDPDHRYATCREFVEALLKVSGSGGQFHSNAKHAEFNTPPQFTVEPSQRQTKTEFFDEEEAPAWQAASQLVAELPPSNFRVTDLPPIELVGRDQPRTPTLVLGIGGTAGRVLSHLRRMIHEQFAGSHVPAVQLLLLDTDSRALASAAQGDAIGLTADETLSLPLRRPQHYRDNSQQLLHWLSRRWLYNIPRSLRTEGLRPLGRLALADHARQAGQRIRRAMAQAVDPQSLADSRAATGQQFREGALRVVVVASVSGGTGGGMALDIGYAVRAILQRIGVADSHVIGMMMHSTDRDARHSELARVNAFSWLSEFNHFHQGGHAYPGDASCGLPAHAPGVSAFDETYLVHLGDGLERNEFDQATQAVSEYLQLDALTAAGTFFDACRKFERLPDAAQKESRLTSLRSFGLSRRTPASSQFCETFAGAISRHVFSLWTGADRKPSAATENTFTIDPEFLQFARRFQLDAACIAANSRALVDVQLGVDPAKFLLDRLQKSGAVAATHSAQLRVIDDMFSGRYEGDVDGEMSLAGTPVSRIIQPLAEKLRSELRRWITRRIDDPSQRILGARRAVQWVNDHLLKLCNQLHEHQSALSAALEQKRANVNSSEAHIAVPDAARQKVIGTNANEYFVLSLDLFAALAGRHLINHMMSEIKALSDEITALGREIDQIGSVVGRAVGQASSNVADGNTWRSASEAKLAAELCKRLPAIAEQVDARLQGEYLDPLGGLAKTIMQGGRPRAQLTAKLQEFSRQAVYQAIAGVDVLNEPDSDHAANDDLKSSLALAMPALLEFGGNRRVLAILPRDAETQQAAIVRRLGVPVTTVAGMDGNLTLCVEAESLSLPHIALELVERRRDRVEFAGRIHCRTDIDWTPLISTAPQDDASAWVSEGIHQTQSQNAMSKTLVL
jgi:serine/threonine protein kinase